MSAAIPSADDLNVVICYQQARYRLRDAVVSPNEILVGPNVETEMVDGRVRSVHATDRIYDLEKIVADLPAAQKPDFVLVRAAPDMDGVPANVARMKCPTALLAGETHHCYPAPQLRNLMRYALNQEFDLVFSESSREHLHFFAEAGVPRTLWLPFFNVPIHEVATPNTCEPIISFIGYLDEPYPRRRRMLHALAEHGLPVFHKVLFGREMAEACAAAQINFNCSLNGDLNYRIGEILAAGGCLLSDRLAPASGLEELFADGEELVLYDGAEDLIAAAERLLADPQACRDIAARGQAKYLRDHRPETKIAQLLAALFEGEIDLPQGTGSSDEVFDRAAVFEFLLELHRENERPEVLFHPGAGEAIFADAAALARLRRHRPGSFDGPFHAVVISARELAEMDAAEVMDGRRVGFVVVPDLESSPEGAAVRAAAETLGARIVEPCPFAFDCRAVRPA